MFFNEKTHRWEKHPDCTCNHEPCYCSWLRPLDRNGKPLAYPAVDAIRERHDEMPDKKKGAA